MKLILENWRRFLLKENKQKILSIEEYNSLTAEQQLQYAKAIGFSSNDDKYSVRVRATRYTVKDLSTMITTKTKNKFTKEQFDALKYPEKSGLAGEVFNASAHGVIPSWLPWLKKLLRVDKIPGSNLGKKLIGPLGDQVKKEWKKNSDMSYFNSFVYVHGFQEPAYFRNFVSGGADSVDEISVIGYPSSGIVGRKWGTVGVILEGDVVYAFGEDGRTDNLVSGRKTSRKAGKKDVKYTGTPERLITNKKNHELYKTYYPSIAEAILENWKIKGIVVQDPTKVDEGFKKILMELSKKYKLYNNNFKQVKSIEELL